jgi:hypothetical protein
MVTILEHCHERQLELGHQEKIDAPPNSLKDSNVNVKVKTIEEKRIEVHSLAHNTSGVRGACCNFEMGTRMSDKRVNYSYGPTQTKQ